MIRMPCIRFGDFIWTSMAASLILLPYLWSFTVITLEQRNWVGVTLAENAFIIVVSPLGKGPARLLAQNGIDNEDIRRFEGVHSLTQDYERRYLEAPIEIKTSWDKWIDNQHNGDSHNGNFLSANRTIQAESPERMHASAVKSLRGRRYFLGMTTGPEIAVKVPPMDIGCTIVVLLMIRLCVRSASGYYRRSRNICVQCRYSLVGNESGRCPECGAVIVRRPVSM